MTIPYLSNCGHADSGWCQSCVKQLGEQYDRAVVQLEDIIDNDERNRLLTLLRVARVWENQPVNRSRRSVVRDLSDAIRNCEGIDA